MHLIVVVEGGVLSGEGLPTRISGGGSGGGSVVLLSRIRFAALPNVFSVVTEVFPLSTRPSSASHFLVRCLMMATAATTHRREREGGRERERDGWGLDRAGPNVWGSNRIRSMGHFTLNRMLRLGPFQVL